MVKRPALLIQTVGLGAVESLPDNFLDLPDPIGVLVTELDPDEGMSEFRRVSGFVDLEL